MRVVLVAVHTGRGPQAVPLANAFLQAYLTTQPDLSVETARVDVYLGESPTQCVEMILTEHPDAVAFSLYLWNRDLCREIVAHIRRQAPGIRLFAGGPEATASPESVLDDGYDFLICGEGERPWADVCRTLATGGDVSLLAGVASGASGAVTLVPGNPLSDLDSIPSPWLAGILDAMVYPGILWQLSRGCSFGCEFCFDSRDRHGVRRFSLQRIEAELRHFAASGVSQVFVLDSTFNQDRERAKKILRLIRRIAPLIHFHFEVRSEFIDREMAELFAAITCSLQIGLQSADPSVLKQVGRMFRPDEFVSRTMLLNDSGAVFGFDLIYGLPGDTLPGFRKSLDFALALYPNHLDIFPLAILPGTALAGRAAALGLDWLEKPPYTLLAAPTFVRTDMDAAGQLAAACDIFYTRGRAVAWFNGVCTLLRVLPSRFLEDFAGWLREVKKLRLDESGLSDRQVWELQREFLEYRFSGKRLQRYLPAVIDLVNYHYHYAAALMSPLPLSTGRKLSGRNIPDARLLLSDSAFVVEFHFDILEILDCGAADAGYITEALRPSRCCAVLYPSVDGVRTEVLDSSYARLLQNLNGSLGVRDAIRGTGLPWNEAVEFISFALEEGILRNPAAP